MEWQARTDVNHIAPPACVIHHLNDLLEADLLATDELISPSDAAKEARVAMAACQETRALRLIRRAIAQEPQHEGLAATAVSLLRQARRQEEALTILRRFRRTTYPPLLTTAAALLCDLERWEDALTVVRRALAASASPEAFLVHARIRSNRPDLF
jgi:predicted Zn-dependent protease